ncbi:alpha/beta hydrolase [Morganella psychrotolerans]|uniref:alpha/beta hydrolase n=1 Tax=Morganella psychrotolerans TaxID=368603 RepID=UPI0039AF6C79
MNKNYDLEDLANFYYNMFFSNLINDLHGILAGPDSSITNKDRDWYRLQQKELLTIPYESPGGKRYELFADLIKNVSNQKKTLILLHGFSGKADNTGAWVKQFYELGFDILTPDLRGHGRNTELNRNFGLHDNEDLLKWINKIVTISPGHDIVLMGISMGAGTMLQTMSSDTILSNVKAAISDSSYRSTVESLIINIGLVLPFLSYEDILAVKDVVNDLLFKDQLIKLEDGLTIDKITHSSYIPLCSISGRYDPLVSPEVTQNIIDAHNNPKDMVFICDNAIHQNSIATDNKKYRDFIHNFLKNSGVI